MTPQPIPEVTALLSDRRWLSGLARGLVGGEPAVEDVLQETHLRAWLHPPADEGRAAGWIRRIASNVARRARSSDDARRGREEAVARHEATIATDEIAARVEMQRSVAEAVLALDEPYRSAILLRYFEDLPPRAIAARLGAPVETVRTRLKRALAQLRTELDRKYGSRDAWSVVLATKLVWPGGAAAMSVATKASIAAVAAILIGFAAWEFGNRPSVNEARSNEIALDVPRAESSVPSPTPDADPALGDERQRASAAAPAAPIRFERVRFVGRVLDGDLFKPVADAIVRIEYYGRDRKWTAAESRSGIEGMFELVVEGMTLDGYSASVMHPDYAVTRASPATSKTSRGSSDTETDLGTLLLQRGTLVSGRVVSLPDHLPVAGAELFVRNAAIVNANRFGPDDAWHAGRSRADGSFELERRVRAEFGPIAILAVSNKRIGFALLSPERSRDRVTDLEVTIEPPGSLAVHVVDDQGSPVANVGLTAYPTFPPFGQGDYGSQGSPRPRILQEPWSSIFLATTGSDGRARFDSLPEGREDALFQNRIGHPQSYRVHAVADGWPELYEGALIARGEESTLEIKLSRAGLCRVIGRVVAKDGQPIAGALVHAEGFPDTRTDADGRYATGLKPGRLGMAEMHVSADGFAPDELNATRDWVRAKLVVKRDDPAAPPIEEFEQNFALAHATTVRGRILDEGRNPLAHVVVRAEGLDRVEQQWIKLEPAGGATGADGAFAIDGVAVDYLSLEVEAPAGFLQPFPVRIVPGDQNMIVTLTHVPSGHARAIASVVDATTGAPLDPVHAYARPLSSNASRFPNAKCAAGQATAEDLIVGRWELVVTLNDGRHGRARFEVKQPDETVRIKIAIGERATVDGTILVDGKPMQAEKGHWFVWVRPATNNSGDSGHALDADGRPVSGLTDGCATADEHGRFRVGRLPSGTPIRFVIDGGDRFAETTVVLEPGEKRSIELHVSKPADAKWIQSESLPPGRLMVETAYGDEPFAFLLQAPTGRTGTTLTTERVRPGHMRWRAEFTSSVEYPPRVRVATGEIDLVAGEAQIVDLLGFQ